MLGSAEEMLEEAVEHPVVGIVRGPVQSRRRKQAPSKSASRSWWPCNHAACAHHWPERVRRPSTSIVHLAHVRHVDGTFAEPRVALDRLETAMVFHRKANRLAGLVRGVRRDRLRVEERQVGDHPDLQAAASAHTDFVTAESATRSLRPLRLSEGYCQDCRRDQVGAWRGGARRVAGMNGDPVDPGCSGTW